MNRITATELKNRCGEMLDAARTEPLEIEKNGRVVAILLSKEEHDRLTKADDFVWGSAALAAEKSGFLSPEESFDALKRMMEGAAPQLHKPGVKIPSRSRGKTASSGK